MGQSKTGHNYSQACHNTDTPDKNANAAAHAKYQKGADARERKVSRDFTMDGKSVYQSLPTNEEAVPLDYSDRNASCKRSKPLHAGHSNMPGAEGLETLQGDPCGHSCAPPLPCPAMCHRGQGDHKGPGSPLQQTH
jgi:hypothetical protein